MIFIPRRPSESIFKLSACLTVNRLLLTAKPKSSSPGFDSGKWKCAFFPTHTQQSRKPIRNHRVYVLLQINHYISFNDARRVSSSPVVKISIKNQNFVNVGLRSFNLPRNSTILHSIPSLCLESNDRRLSLCEHCTRGIKEQC